MKNKNTYIASCHFTTTYPHLSDAIQKYVQQRWKMQIMRCCTPKYQIKKTENEMPNTYKAIWKTIVPHNQPLEGDTIYSICNNCLAVIQETHPTVQTKSIWELVDADTNFSFPDFGGKKMTIQDCWRCFENENIQKAVRSILSKMNISVIELEESREKTNFCGTSLYRAGSVRTLKLAPNRYVKNGKGKFIPHTTEEIKTLMEVHAHKFSTKEVVTYCHTCQIGLKLGGLEATHLAELLFVDKSRLQIKIKNLVIN